MSSPRPGSKPLATRERKRLIDRLVQAQREEGLTVGAVARALRYSPAVWSQVRDGKYKGDVDKFLRRGGDWLEHRSRRAMLSEAVYASTSIGEQVVAVCRTAAAMPTIGRIITPSGCGKTAALAAFAREAGERCLHLQIGQAFHTLRGVLTEIARRLKIAGAASRTTPDLYALVRDHVARFYAGGANDPFVLLADETTTLRGNALDMLRNLHDDPAARIGLVLADTDLLDERFKGRDAYRHGAEQTLGRCAAVYRFARDRKIPIDDVRAVGTSILRTLGFDGTLDRAAWSYLADVANRPGRFHNVKGILMRCREIVEAAGREAAYTAPELDFVARLVDLEPRWEHPVPPWELGAETPAAETAVA